MCGSIGKRAFGVEIQTRRHVRTNSETNLALFVAVANVFDDGIGESDVERGVLER